MVRKYVKRPIPVEAVKWTGENELEIVNFTSNVIFNADNNCVIIHTLEGDMTASVGDYIIKGVRGEFYPCAHDIFEETYQEVEG